MTEETKQPTFDRVVRTTIDEALGILNQRKGEYLDSWAIENVYTPFQDLVEREVVKVDDPRVLKRLRTMAAMIDVKLSRLGGPWKRDTGVDTINYVAAFTQLMAEAGY